MANWAEKRGAWLGWPDVPSPSIQGGDCWRDLSHVVTEDLSRGPTFPRPTIERIEELPDSPANVTFVSMALHHGTHVDAPNHFYFDGPSMAEVPLEMLYGRGMLYRVETEPGGVIGIEDLLASAPAPERGDIVLLDTGSHQKINTPAYEDAPSLSPEAAIWLRDHGVKLVGIDAATPDLPASRRGEGFDWPVHRALLGSGVLIAEHVANLSALQAGPVEAVFGVTVFAEADAGPARVMARNL